jgi:hypothetical protein
VAVENASYKWAFIFITFALLIDVMYRGAVRNEAAWDLMALVIISSGLCTMYQARQKIMWQGWVWKVVLIACLGGAISFIIALVLTMIRAK